MASSGKPLGEPQLAVPPGPNIILLSGMREVTNDQVGSGLHDHSFSIRLLCSVSVSNFANLLLASAYGPERMLREHWWEVQLCWYFKKLLTASEVQIKSFFCLHVIPIVVQSVFPRFSKILAKGDNKDKCKTTRASLLYFLLQVWSVLRNTVNTR